MNSSFGRMLSGKSSIDFPGLVLGVYRTYDEPKFQGEEGCPGLNCNSAINVTLSGIIPCDGVSFSGVNGSWTLNPYQFSENGTCTWLIDGNSCADAPDDPNCGYMGTVVYDSFPDGTPAFLVVVCNRGFISVAVGVQGANDFLFGFDPALAQSGPNRFTCGEAGVLADHGEFSI